MLTQQPTRMQRSGKHKKRIVIITKALFSISIESSFASANVWAHGILTSSVWITPVIIADAFVNVCSRQQKSMKTILSPWSYLVAVLSFTWRFFFGVPKYLDYRLKDGYIKMQTLYNSDQQHGDKIIIKTHYCRSDLQTSLLVTKVWICSISMVTQNLPLTQV